MSVLNFFLNMKKVDDESVNLSHQLFFNQNITNKLLQVVEQQQLDNSSKLKVLYIYGPVRLFGEGFLFLLSVYNDHRTQIKRISINFKEITALIDRYSTLQQRSSSSTSLNGSELMTQNCKIYWRYAKPIEIDANVDYQAFTYLNCQDMPKVLQNYFQFEIKHSILNHLFRKKKIFFSEKIEKTSKFIQISVDLLKLTQIQSLKSFLYQDIIINMYLEMNKIMFTEKRFQSSTVDSKKYLANLTEMEISKLIVYKSNEELQQIAEMSVYSGQNNFKQDNLLIIPLKSNDLGNNYYFYRNNTIYIIQITVIHKLNLNHKLKLLAKLFHRASGVLTNLWQSIYGKQLRFQLIFISYDNRRSVYEKIEKGLFSSTVFSQSNQFMAFEDFKYHLNDYNAAKIFFENIEEL